MVAAVGVAVAAEIGAVVTAVVVIVAGEGGNQPAVTQRSRLRYVKGASL